LVGFIESPTRGDASVIPTALVAEFLRDVATAYMPVHAGTPLLGLDLETTVLAELEGHRVRTGPGAVVTGIVKDSPAARAGLTVGDVVTRFDDATVEAASQVTARVRSSAPGSLHIITVRQADGRASTVEIRLTAHA
jgi:S1-C subfamily serine protease